MWSSERVGQDEVEKSFETPDNEVQHHNSIESSGSNKKAVTKQISKKLKNRASSYLRSSRLTTKIAQVKVEDNKMEDIGEKVQPSACENVSIDNDSVNASNNDYFTSETVNDVTSQFQDDSIDSERVDLSLSNSSEIPCEIELQSNEVTSESLLVSQGTGSNENEAEAKMESCDLLEVSLPRSNIIDKSASEIDCKPSEVDDHVSSSELAKDFSDAIPDLNTEDKSSTQDNHSEEMEIDIKVTDKEETDFKQITSLQSKDLVDNIFSDNAVDNTTFDNTEMSLAPIDSINESLLLDKDVDSTNDSQILERDLKLSDDSSDNLIIIDEVSETKGSSSSSKVLKKSENDDPKTFEKLVGVSIESEVNETVEDNKNVSDNSASEVIPLKEESEGKSTISNTTEKSEISTTSETRSRRGKLSRKNNMRLTISVEKDSITQPSSVGDPAESSVLNSKDSDTSSSNSLSKRSASIKRKVSSDGIKAEEEVLTSDVKPTPTKNRNSKLNISIKQEIDPVVCVPKKSGKKVSKLSSKVKENVSKEDNTSLSENLDAAISKDSKSSNIADDIGENASLKSLIVNTPLPSNESLLTNSPLTDAPHVQQNGKIPLRTPRNKVKKRPYSPEMAPPPSVNKTSTPSNKTPAALNKSLTSTPQTSSPSSAQRKKLKKYNEEDVVIPFKYGWMRELVHRSTTSGKARASDVYYFTPEGNKLRSMPEVSKYLADREGHGLTGDNFTFAKETIYRSPFEVERDANVKSNINVSAIKTPSSEKKKPAKKSSGQNIVESPQLSSTKLESTPTVEKSSDKKLTKSEISSIEKSKSSSKSFEKQTAKSSEKQTAKSSEKQTAKSSEKQIAKSSEKQTVKSSEKQTVKSSEKQQAKSEQILEKRKAEPESNILGTRKTRLRSSDSISSNVDSSAKDNADKTEHKSKSAKLSSDSVEKPKKVEKILKVKFTKTYGKGKTATPSANIRGSGDIEDDLHRILTTSVVKSANKDTDKKTNIRAKSAPAKSSQQKKKKKL